MESFLQQIQQADAAAVGGHPTLAVVLTTLLLSAAVGSFLAFIYSVTYTGKKEDRTQIIFTIILLCIGGALVWLIVADNLVRAFGLAGALSLIRYRTNVNDPKDTSLVFFSLMFGMACGVHQYITAIAGVTVLSLVLVIMKLASARIRATMPITPPPPPIPVEQPKEEASDGNGGGGKVVYGRRVDDD